MACRPQPPGEGQSAQATTPQTEAQVQELVTASLDGTVRVWSLGGRVGGGEGGGSGSVTAARCRTLQAPGRVESLVLPPGM